jgi:hypothetical protein
LGWRWSLDFHNQIARSYLTFHIKSISDTLYCFTSHLEKSKNKNKNVWPIFQGHPWNNLAPKIWNQ